MRRRSLVLSAGLALLTSVSARAQPADSLAAAAPRPTVGLVLSGGAAKGLAHIGVLKVLEAEGVPVDVVSGTSMGALIGGLYAMGYSADDLDRIAHELPLAELFADGVERAAQRLEQRRLPDGTLVRLPIAGGRVRLPSGLIAGQEVMLALARLTWPVHGVDDFADLPRPFATNAVDLISGESVRITDGALADAMRASMSLPTIFYPVERGGRPLVDGGLVRNLPADEARSLGADLLVGVDVSGAVVDGEVVLSENEGTPDASFLSVLVNATTLGNRASVRGQRDVLDVLVEPDVTGLSPSAFDAVDAWIARGEAAARARLPEIRALVARLGGPAQTRPVPPPTRPVRVASVRLVGVGEATPEGRLVRARLGLRLPADLTPDAVEAAIGRVYGTGLFDRVSYRVRPGAGGAPGVLEVRAEPQRVPDRLAAGLRYDEFYGAALLVSYQTKNRLRFGDTAALTVRAGDQAQLAASYFTRLGLSTPLSAGAEASVTSAPFDGYFEEPPPRDAAPVRLRQRVASGSVLGGVALSNAALAGVRLRAEAVRSTIAQVPFSYAPDFTVADPTTGEAIALNLEGTHIDDRIASAGVFLDLDTRDRVVYPTRGLRVDAEAEFGHNRSASASVAARAADFYVALGATPEEAAAEAAAAFPDVRGPFGRARLDAEAFVPVGRVSVFVRAAVSRATGDALPASYAAYVGGQNAPVVFSSTFFPLLGLRPQERTGTHAYLGVLGVQVPVGTRALVRALVNAGDAYYPEAEGDAPDPSTGFRLARAAVGVGAEVGLTTPIGPVGVAVGTPADRLRPRLSLNVGFRF